LTTLWSKEKFACHPFTWKVTGLQKTAFTELKHKLLKTLNLKHVSTNKGNTKNSEKTILGKQYDNFMQT